MADPRDPDAAYIPADDVILRGYCGPADFLQYRTWYPGVTLSPTHGYISRPGHGDDIAGYSPANIRLNPALAPVRDHIARVMAAGAPCHICLRAKFPDAPACATCRGSGYLLPSAPIEHLLDRPGSKLTAAQSAACVAWSYQSWRRGGAVLRGIAVFIESEPQGAHSWRERGNLCAHDSIGNPRTFGVWPVRNTQDCYDAVLHERYYATVNDDGSVTTPDLPTDRSHK